MDLSAAFIYLLICVLGGCIAGVSAIVVLKLDHYFMKKKEKEFVDLMAGAGPSPHVSKKSKEKLKSFVNDDESAWQKEQKEMRERERPL